MQNKEQPIKMLLRIHAKWYIAAEMREVGNTLQFNVNDRWGSLPIAQAKVLEDTPENRTELLLQGVKITVMEP